MPQPPPVHAFVEHAPPDPPPDPPRNDEADSASAVRSLPQRSQTGPVARSLIRRMASMRVPQSLQMYS
jgi:hypothetical protein